MASLALLFGGWFVSRLLFNVYNNKALKIVKTHVTVSYMQILLGCVYVLVSWLTGLRRAPTFDMISGKALLPIAVCHAFAHACAVLLGRGAGSVGLILVIQAAEPLFTAIFSTTFLHQYLLPSAYGAIATIVVGLAVANVKGFNFSPFELLMAVCFASAASGRWILAKKFMRTPQGEAMGPANLCGVVTLVAAVLLFWLAVLVDGANMFNPIGLDLPEESWFLQSWFLSGLSLQLSNELAFRALKNLHPVTHAVIRVLVLRIGVVIVSVLIFQQPLTVAAIAGCTVAGIGGVFYASSVKAPQ